MGLNPLFLPPPSSLSILDQPSKSLQQPPFNSLSSSFCRRARSTRKLFTMAAEEHDLEFDSADAGASLTYPMQCSALRKNGFVVIKGRPMKIVDMSTSKTGKHGHAKVNLVGINIFTGKKAEDMSPSTHNMEVPVVTRKEYQLVDLDEDGFMSLMDPNSGETKDDVQISENPS